MTNITTIYVYLPEEAVDVWRPVLAEHLHGNVYLITEQPYNREDEKWQFEPGEEVECEWKTLPYNGRIFAATKKANNL